MVTVEVSKSKKVAKSASKKPKRAKQKPVKGKDKQKDSSQQTTTSRKETLPLKGIVLSISTLNDSKGDNDIGTYSSVSKLCRDLGAEVLGQVGKRVKYMICTVSAVEQATQRVRKANKKRIPIVNIGWLEKCKEERKLMSVTEYRMDEQAKAAIEARAKKQTNATTNDCDDAVEGVDVPPDDAGWTQAVSLGCCCVCHENRAARDCKWCKDLPCATQ